MNAAQGATGKSWDCSEPPFFFFFFTCNSILKKKMGMRVSKTKHVQLSLATDWAPKRANANFTSSPSPTPPCTASLAPPLALLWDGSRGLAGTAEFTPGLSSGPWHPGVDPGLSRATSRSKVGLQYTDLGGATSRCPWPSFLPTHILSLLYHPWQQPAS